MTPKQRWERRCYGAFSEEDESERFIKASTIHLESSALTWWLEQSQQSAYPYLSRLALDIFSIPPMSAEAERVFSGARRTITWDRASLGASIVEMTECLKSWIRSRLSYGVISTPDEVESLAIVVEQSI